MRLGVWWGLGHGSILLGAGLPLIALEAELPGAFEATAEVAVGVLIAALAARVTWRWLRGDLRGGLEDDRPSPRTPAQAFGIGVLHGLAGTGAVVLLLIAALPTQLEAAMALAVFAPMTIVSMAALTGALGWLLTRPRVEPVYRAVLIPALGLFGVMFGLWYAGVG